MKVKQMETSVLNRGRGCVTTFDILEQCGLCRLNHGRVNIKNHYATVNIAVADLYLKPFWKLIHVKS
jgi:hypothetical protein